MSGITCLVVFADLFPKIYIHFVHNQLWTIEQNFVEKNIKLYKVAIITLYKSCYYKFVS